MADIDALVAGLTLDEKVALLAGEDLWSTVAVERLGIPKIVVTDGPNGARGPGLPGASATPSTCIPCGSALGATWDPDLVEALGALVGREARDRGCRVLLAPTVNLHRSPRAGRNFECYSEDPHLTGRLAAGFVRGVQSAGVIATVKHFVGNEAEFERHTMDSVIDDRALRELYLVPFEHAVRDGGALGLMTAYNRVNGRWVTEQPALLRDLVRGEWGFTGLVMTDWFGIAHTVDSIAAGLDLEMPGPPRAYGPALADAVRAAIVDEAAVDGAVARLLTAFDAIGALRPDPPGAAERLPAPPGDAEVALVRRAAAAATVLLHHDGILPLDPSAVGRLAVIGPAADDPALMGGGSAEVAPWSVTSPLDALRDAFGAGAVVHAPGSAIDRSPRPLGGAGLRAPEGFTVDLHPGPGGTGDPIAAPPLRALRTFSFGAPDPALTGTDWSMRIRGTVVPAESGAYTLALAQAGRARVLVDGVVVVDGVTDPMPPGGTEFFGLASHDRTAEVAATAGQPLAIEVQLDADDAFAPGVRVGFRSPEDPDRLERAVAVAAAAEVAIVLVGTNREWESEGHDRADLTLPGDQSVLVERVAATGTPTIVVVNAGAPIDVTWSDRVAATLMTWLGGQELGPAIADVLTGAAEPGGRLPTTFPARLEHSPAHDNFPGENGQVRYGEGVFTGYRGFEHRAIEPRFAFGHGLGYTTFTFGDPVPSSTTFTPGDRLIVAVRVTNSGPRDGATVVQAYVAPCGSRLARPPKELVAFAKVHVEAGATRTVELVLDDRAFAYWDPGQPDVDTIAARAVSLPGPLDRPTDRRAPGWQVDPGTYDVVIGRSSADLTGRCAVEVVVAEA